MRNIHPADELAMIRADLHRLKEREAFLKNGFLTMRLPTRGEGSVASVKILKQRRFRREMLPRDVLDNADFWETQIVRHVQVDDVANLPTAARRRVLSVEDADVIERF